MELHIISPQQTQTFSIAWLEVNTPAGNFIIQDGYAPTVLLLAPNKPLIFRLKSGKQETILPRQGVVEVARDSATVLMNE